MSDAKTERVKGRLELSNSKLNTLLKVTNAINNNSSKKELFGLLRNVLMNELHIGRFIIFTRDQQEWKSSMIEGVSTEEVERIDSEAFADKYQTIDSLNSIQQGVLAKFDIIIPVYNKERPLAYVLLADFEGEKIEISPIIKHLRFIQTLANIIVVALENKRLNREYIKQVAVKKELELAQNMQSLLFPRSLPNTKELTVEAYYQPHSEVGGDYYDIVKLKGGKTALCIADVSGKGISAAILMANFQANLRALLNVSSNLIQLGKSLNEKVIESANYEKFVTLFVAVFDPTARKLSYLNAGHQPAILIKNNSIELLKKGCTVLGMFENLPEIESGEILLENNSKMICFTDGLIELQDTEGKHIEVEGIKALLNPEHSLYRINTNLLNEIDKRDGLTSSNDDITFLTAEFLR